MPRLPPGLLPALVQLASRPGHAAVLDHACSRAAHPAAAGRRRRRPSLSGRSRRRARARNEPGGRARTPHRPCHGRQERVLLSHAPRARPPAGPPGGVRRAAQGMVRRRRERASPLHGRDREARSLDRSGAHLQHLLLRLPRQSALHQLRPCRPTRTGPPGPSQASTAKPATGPARSTSARSSRPNRPRPTEAHRPGASRTTRRTRCAPPATQRCRRSRTASAPEIATSTRSIWSALESPDFYPDGRDLGENYTFTAWRSSPCAKSGQLDCLHCHTSSGRYRFEDAARANQACLPCHEARVQDGVAHSHHPDGKTTCIDCHMPKTEFARMVRSDHSMRPPAPAATIAFGFSERLQPVPPGQGCCLERPGGQEVVRKGLPGAGAASRGADCGRA